MLTGFMGAGKSTIGGLLAARLGWRLMDTDDALTRSHGSPVPDLFARHGEAGFRELEQQIITELLGVPETVIALGGGALEHAGTRNALFTTPGTHVVFLETPLAIAVARCEQQKGGASRPVLADRSRLAARFAERTMHYRAAHTTVATEGRMPEAVLELLLATPPLSDLRRGGSKL